MRRLAVFVLLTFLGFTFVGSAQRIHFLQATIDDLRTKGTPVYDVTAYGALCDGTTDDTTAIAAAFTAAAAGGTVQLPRGTCIITAALLPNSNTRLVGAGIGASILKLPAGATTFTGGIVDVGAKTNIEIAHLTIDGNLDNNSGLAAPSNIRGAGATNVWIHNIESKNSVAGGIFFGSTGGLANTRILIASNVVSNCKSAGISVANARDALVSDNMVRATGAAGIALLNGEAAADFPKRSSIIGNVIDRSTAPSQGTQSGFLITYSWSGEDVIVSDNVALGAIDSSQGDGIGWVRLASSQSGSRISITGNTVHTTEGFGIDIPPDGIVANNVVNKPGTHGIALAADDLTPATNYAYNNVVVSGNIVIDPDATNIGADTYGIIIGDSSNANRTIDSLIITGNSISDAVGRMDYALSLQADAGSPITNCVITGNDFSQAGTAAIKWWQQGGGAMTAGITKLRVRNNLTFDAYSGEGTLSGGTLSVRSATSLHWPELTTIKFGVTRTGIGATGANPIGLLDAVWTAATRNLTVTSHDVTVATTTEGSDVSTFFWEFLGTAN